jgi:hypothetical protein
MPERRKSAPREEPTSGLLLVFLCITLGHPFGTPFSEFIGKLLPAFALPSSIILVKFAYLFISPMVVVIVELIILVLPAGPPLRTRSVRSTVLAKRRVPVSTAFPVNPITIVLALVPSPAISAVLILIVGITGTAITLASETAPIIPILIAPVIIAPPRKGSAPFSTLFRETPLLVAFLTAPIGVVTPKIPAPSVSSGLRAATFM